MTALRFRTGVRVEVVDDSRLFLLSDAQSTIVENPATVAVAGLIDGKRTTAEIMSASPLRIDQTFIELTKLMTAGHVVDGPEPNTAAARFIEGRRLEKALADVGEFVVEVADLTDLGSGQLLTEELSPLGIAARPASLARTSDHQAADLCVVFVDDYLDERLRAFNEWAYANKAPWLIVKPAGRRLWVGPYFAPGEGCWECLNERVAANRQVERYVATSLAQDVPNQTPSFVAPGAAQMAVAMVVNDIVSVAGGGPSAFSGLMRTLDLISMRTAEHTLVSQPHCAVSGWLEGRRQTEEVQLTADTAEHTVDGGYRVCPPEETYRRLEHHISAYFGAVAHLESLNHDEEGVAYSFVAGHNFGMLGGNMELLKGNMRGQSGGKGRTEIQAKVSGICEALERFSGVWVPGVDAVRTTWNNMGERALHPYQVLGYSERQYAERHAWNANPGSRLQRIPDPFDEDREIDFTAARSLTTGERVMIPSGLVWFGHRDLHDHTYAITDSNGGAAGNTMDEAVLQGLCELYERDSVALWWFNRIARPGVDLDSFEDPYIDRMKSFYDSLDRDIWVLDLTSDLGTPTFAALSRRRHAIEDVMLAFGAHPDPDIALFRALTELNQFLPFIRNRDAEGNTIYGVDDAATLEWCQNTTVEKEPWLLPDPALPMTTRDSLVRDLPASLGDLVQSCVADLASRNLETIVVNQSRPDIELAVAKVFVPGMRHFWKRTGPGRLYDVPVQMGWRDAPLTEDELNPVGVFF